MENKTIKMQITFADDVSLDDANELGKVVQERFGHIIKDLKFPIFSSFNTIDATDDLVSEKIKFDCEMEGC